MQGRRLTRADWTVGLLAIAWMVFEDLAWESETSTGIRVATGVLAVAPAFLARRHPIGVGLWLCGAISVRYALDAQPWENAMPFAVTLALAYYSGREAPDRRTAARRGLLSVGPYFVIQALLDPGQSDLGGYGLTLGFLICCWGVGNGVRERWMETRALLRDRAMLERSRAAELRSATAEERARIARELHAIVTAATLRTRAAAEAAGDALRRRDPDAAERHLADAQGTTHTTVDDLRRLLRVLRSAPAEEPAAAALPAESRTSRIAGWALLAGPTLLFTVIGVTDQFRDPAGAWTVQTDVTVLQAIGIALVPALPLLGRLRAPLAAALAVAWLFALEVAVGWMAVTSYSSWTLTGIAGWVCLRHAGGWPAAAAVVGVFVPLEVMMAADPIISTSDIIFMTLWPALAAAAGFGLRRRELEAQRTRREHAEALEARTRELEAALAGERRAIAREMHDVVGHALTLLAIHAAAARRYVVRDPAVAGAHVDIVRSAAADAEVELERLLATIGGPLGGAAEPDQPGARDLERLVHGSGARFEADFDPAAVPESVGLAAYRIVQEALTNARKHAPGADVVVRARDVRGMLELSVVNDAPRRPGHTRLSAGGHGLAGMAERVRLFAGEFGAGPYGHGGWRVRAALPTGHLPQAPVFALAEREATAV